MAKAVCIRCGEPKQEPFARCSRCGFCPNDDAVAEAKSVILSVKRYRDANDQARYEGDLDKVSQAIRGGVAYEFDHDELNALLRERSQLMQPFTASEMIKLFLIVLGFLAIPVIAIALYLFRSIK